MFDLFSQSWFFFRRNYVYFFPVLLLLSVSYLLASLASYTTSMESADQVDFGSISQQLQAMYIDPSFWWMFGLYFVESPMLLLVAKWRISVPDISVGRLLYTVLIQVWALVFRFFCVALFVALPCSAVIGLLFMLSQVLQSLTLLASMVVFSGLLYVFVRLSLVIPVLVEENSSPIHAIRTSWKASQGKVKTIIGGYFFAIFFGLITVMVAELVVGQFSEIVVDWFVYFLSIHVNCLVMIFLYRLYLIVKS